MAQMEDQQDLRQRLDNDLDGEQEEYDQAQ
jgi:hypothetical protein